MLHVALHVLTMRHRGQRHEPTVVPHCTAYGGVATTFWSKMRTKLEQEEI
jgi:hypothetical protein